ncbi:MAG TPA: response regulator transcription factor [Verrucomicrobiae bacterium]|jgi:DNA-binding NarL/FixJ family response regulator|nr:response regulator transcription factor [Verrucomicrobiae bacterium]
MSKQPPDSSFVNAEAASNDNGFNWKVRLILRRYRFPASGESEQDLAVRIDHAGTGYFFPLGTPDLETAAAKAARIYQTATKKGWNSVFKLFPRELIVSFEWCANPVLWTYTTIHTLVGKGTGSVADPVPTNPNRQRVLVVELDAGIRRALCWSIDQQAGFGSIPCDSAESFSQALALHKPRMVLLNRNLAGRVGHKSAGTIAPIQPGVPALTYSVHIDGDQMFVSTPGGAGGYLVKRIRPDRLLEPIVNVVSRSELMTDDLLLRVKYYFQELLQLPSSHDNSALARLTLREREVLALLSKGCVDKEIAQAMGISVWTVHGHVKRIFAQLNVRTRTEAVIQYLEK